nr:MAG TPA: hypothetical protein [Caudoviricetes sp.]
MQHQASAATEDCTNQQPRDELMYRQSSTISRIIF